MLDKQLCAAFGIDEFNQWIASELVHIEEQLYESTVSSPRYIELRVRYQALKDARQRYMDFHYNRLKTNTTETADRDIPKSAT